MNYSNQVATFKKKSKDDRMFCSHKKKNNDLETWETYLDKRLKIKSKKNTKKNFCIIL
jgi:endogenous inhibitor of DNA gyrase (YacG/DUF329 family)